MGCKKFRQVKIVSIYGQKKKNQIFPKLIYFSYNKEKHVKWRKVFRILRSLFTWTVINCLMSKTFLCFKVIKLLISQQPVHLSLLSFTDTSEIFSTHRLLFHINSTEMMFSYEEPFCCIEFISAWEWNQRTSGFKSCMLLMCSLGLAEHNISTTCISFPKDKIVDWSKWKAFADNKINATKKIEICVRKRKKCGYVEICL